MMAEQGAVQRAIGSRLLGGLTLKELAIRVWRETVEDKAFGRAAELAYFFLLALFPLLIFLLSVFSFLPGLQDELLVWLAKVMPREAMRLIVEWMQDVVNDRSGGLLSLSLLGSLWAASTGMNAVINVLNTAYDVKQERPFWKARFIALSLTLALIIFIVSGQVLIMFGDWLALWLAKRLGFGALANELWRYVDYLAGLLLLVIGVGLIYHFAPNVQRRWRLVTPGAVFAVLASVVVSLLFSLYLRVAPGYNATYGSLGAVIILMLWLYLLGLALFLGGEINAEIEHAQAAIAPDSRMTERNGAEKAPA